MFQTTIRIYYPMAKDEEIMQAVRDFTKKVRSMGATGGQGGDVETVGRPDLDKKSA